MCTSARCVLVSVVLFGLCCRLGAEAVPQHSGYSDARKPDLAPFLNRPYELRGRPRIHLNERRIARLKGDTNTVNALKQGAAGQDKAVNGPEDGEINAIAARMAYGALAYVATGDEKLAEQVGRRIEVLAKTGLAQSGRRRGFVGLAMANSPRLSAVAFGLDWCYDKLTPEQRKAAAEFLKTGLRTIVVPWKSNFGGWENFAIRGWPALMAAALAIGDIDDEGKDLMLAAQKHWEISHGSSVGLLPGGGWPEGPIYAAIVSPPHVLTADAVSTATRNVDYFKSHGWYRNRLKYFMHSSGPVARGASWWYLAQGDAERNRPPMMEYEHVTQVVLMDNFHDTREAAEAHYRLKQLGGRDLNASGGMNLGGRLLLLALFYDPKSPAEKPAECAFYAPGTETAFIRSDWSPDAAWLMFQCGPRFGYHQHQDQGMFCIFKKGDLAIESGTYDGGGIGEMNNNMGAYYTRAIAHNVMLFYNPGETFASYRSGRTVRNDGGQRTWSPAGNGPSPVSFVDKFYACDTGHVIAFEETPAYAYVAGDVTTAYNSTHYTTLKNIPKLREWTRQIVFVRKGGEGTNDLIVIFDRTETTLPDFQKKWLLHSLNEPVVDGKASVVSAGEFLHDGSNAVVTAGEGKLFCRTLLPEKHRIRKLGGKGVKDQWVFGREIIPDANDFEDTGYGDWRLEVEPSAPAKRDLFLHVLVPTDGSQEKAPESTLKGESAVEIADGKRKVVVTFAADGTPGGQLEINEPGKPPVNRALQKTQVWQAGPAAPAGIKAPPGDTTPAPDPNRKVFVFQQYIHGYMGCRAGTINGGAPDHVVTTAEAAKNGLELYGDDKGNYIFLKFDKLDLPPDKTPTAGTIRLTVLKSGKGGPQSFTVHRMAEELDYGQVTWNYRDAGKKEKWGNGKADSRPQSGIDYEEKPVAACTVTAVEGRQVEIDVLELVKDWTAKARNNQGIILVAKKDNGVGSFCSPEDADDAKHPRLDVSFVPPPGADRVLVLRQGVAPYQGCEDVMIDGDHPDTNLLDDRSERGLSLFGDDSGNWVFIRFSDIKIPEGKRIASVKLAFTLRQKVQRGDEAEVSCHRLVKKLDFSKLSWGYRDVEKKEKWGDGKAESRPQPGIDFVEKPEDVVKTVNLEVGEELTFDVTAAVRDWVRDPTTNTGLVLRPAHDTATGYLESTQQAVTARPRLILNFEKD